MLKFFKLILSFILSFIFRLVTDLRNFLYDKNFLKQIDVKKYTGTTNLKSLVNVKSHPQIISIGNLSTGGSGKTPLTIFITNYLISQNFKVAVIGRGYGRSSKKNILLLHSLHNENILEKLNPQEIGDEMFEIFCNTKADIYIGNSKSEQALIASKKDYHYIVIDDGFQHRKLKRDLEILIIDKKTIKYPQLLPLGVLRERITNITRAQFVIFRNLTPEQLTKQELDTYHKIQSILKLNSITHFNLQYVIGDFYCYNLNLAFITEFQNKKIILLSAIANPSTFKSNIVEQRISIYQEIIYKDHFNFTYKTIKSIVNKFNTEDYIFLTTEKDWTKIYYLLKNSDLSTHINRFYFVKLMIKNTVQSQELVSKLIHHSESTIH